MLLAGVHDGVGDAFAEVSRHGQFIGKLSGEGDAKEPALETTAEQGDLLRRQIGEGLVGNVLVDDPLQDHAGFWSGKGHLRPLVGD
ncbi:hypothetical protein D3C72_2092560 [compost metagenome]